MGLSLHPIPISLVELEELRTLVSSLSDWNGSLEDATVALTAQRYSCPVWSLNYRDLAIFSTLEFWTPS